MIAPASSHLRISLLEAIVQGRSVLIGTAGRIDTIKDNAIIISPLINCIKDHRSYTSFHEARNALALTVKQPLIAQALCYETNHI